MKLGNSEAKFFNVILDFFKSIFLFLVKLKYIQFLTKSFVLCGEDGTWSLSIRKTTTVSFPPILYYEPYYMNFQIIEEILWPQKRFKHVTD